MVPIRRRWVIASFGLALTLGAVAGTVYLLARNLHVSAREMPRSP